MANIQKVTAVGGEVVKVDAANLAIDFSSPDVKFFVVGRVLLAISAAPYLACESRALQSLFEWDESVNAYVYKGFLSVVSNEDLMEVKVGSHELGLETYFRLVNR